MLLPANGQPITLFHPSHHPPPSTHSGTDRRKSHTGSGASCVVTLSCGLTAAWPSLQSWCTLSSRIFPFFRRYCRPYGVSGRSEPVLPRWECLCFASSRGSHTQWFDSPPSWPIFPHALVAQWGKEMTLALSGAVSSHNPSYSFPPQTANQGIPKAPRLFALQRRAASLVQSLPHNMAISHASPIAWLNHCSIIGSMHQRSFSHAGRSLF